jgi:hypothetical protein
MILFYAPYPSPEFVKNGWMRRIHAIDQIFKDRERHYVFQVVPKKSYDPYDYQVYVQQKEERAWMHWIDFRFSNHLRHLTELVERSRMVYAHTSHSAQFLLPYYRTGKVITDLHGIAPEEERMLKRPNFAGFYEGFEEEMLRQSNLLVVVTEAMAEHYRHKYPGLTTPFIVLPIVNEAISASFLQRSERKRLRVVYAGGVQSWQNPELMMTTIKVSPAEAEYLVYSNDEGSFASLAARHGVAHRVEIAFCPPEQLPAVYAQADLGFVLRDDDPVNRVACPTKLTEYLAYGVVPIIKSKDVGDFDALGYRYITVEDYQGGRIPDHGSLQIMREENFEVYQKLRTIFGESSLKLQQIQLPPAKTSLPRHHGLFLTHYERTIFYPTSVFCSYTQDGERVEETFDDIVSHQTSVVIRPKQQGKLQSISVSIADRPFICRPLRLVVVSETGSNRVLDPTGNYVVDRYGNWLFTGRGGELSIKGLHLDRVEEIRFQLEFIEVGPELLNPSLAPLGFRGVVFALATLWPHLKTLVGRVFA